MFKDHKNTLCALVAWAGIALFGNGWAQTVGPPVREIVDDNGVDLMTGVMTAGYQGISIGPASGGLAFTRTYRKLSHWDSYIGMITRSSDNTVYTVSIGGQTEKFSWSSSLATFTPVERLGSTLTVTTGSPAFYTYTTRDGAVATFSVHQAAYSYPGAASNDYRASLDSMVYPNGERIDINYHTETICIAFGGSGGGSGCTNWQTASRIASITNNNGYKFTIAYGANSNPFAVDPNAFVFPASITAVNMTNGASVGTMQIFLSGDGTQYQLTDPAGRTAFYTRSITLGTTSIRRPGSSTASMQILYTGGKVSSVTRDGLATSYSYVDAGTTRTTTVTPPGGGQRIYVFNLSISQMVSSADELSRSTSYSYDSFARLTRVTAPEGNFVEYTYDARGNITQTRIAAKPGSGLADKLLTADYPASCTNPRTCNQPNWTRDTAGNQTDYTYDPTHGGVLTITQPAPSAGAPRPQTRFGYTALQARYLNSSGVLAPSGAPIYKLTSVSTCAATSSCANTADESRTVIGYGSTSVANNLLPVSITTSDGTGAGTATWTYSYDTTGNLMTADGPLAGTADSSLARYDALRRVVGVVAPDPDAGGPRRHTARRDIYDPQGRLTARETGIVNSYSDSDWAAFALLQRAAFDYDSANRQSKIILADGGATRAVQQYSYDSASRLECVAVRMNPASFAGLPASACSLGSEGSFGPDRIQHYGYNAGHQLLNATSGYGTPNPITESATYTVNGLPETLADGNGNRTTYEYDGFDRPVRTRYPHPTTGGTSSTTDYEAVLAFDANSNPTSLRLRSAATMGLTYDNLNRITVKDLPDDAARDVYFAYDNFGRVTSARFGSQTGSGIVNTFDVPGRSSSTATFGRSVNRSYDIALNQLRITYPDGFYANYNFNVAGEVTSIVDSTGTTLVTYQYDDMGRRLGINRGNGTATSGAYGSAGLLETLTHQLAGTEHDGSTAFTHTPSFQLATRAQTNDAAYSWAPASNSSTSTTVNGLNQFTGRGTATIQNSTLGNISNDGSRGYAYDSENRLTSVTGAATATLAYDPLGTLNSYTVGGTTTQFLYDGPNLIAEFSSSGAVLRRYVHGPGTDEPLVWYDGAGFTNRRYLHADERGSIVAISNDAGTAISTNNYSPFGVRGGGTGSRFAYTGQVALPEVDLLYYKARMYSATLGRFMQADPIGYADGMNRYSYAGGDPINRVDPSGTSDVDLCCNDGGGGGFDFWLTHGSFAINPRSLNTTAFRGDPFHYDMLIRSAQMGGAPVNGYCYPACVPNASGGTIGAVGAAAATVGRYVGSYGTAVGASTAVRGALVFGAGASVVDGPLPAGEAVAATVILAVTAGVVVDKAAKDIAGLVESTRTWAQRPGEVYTLRAAAPGLYPDLGAGGTIYLNAGDVWKVGESINGSGRYPARLYAALGVNYVTEYVGGQLQIKMMEKTYLTRYVIEHRRLPPGNLIFR